MKLLERLRQTALNALIEKEVSKMNLAFLTGYKTYVIGAIMVLIAAAQMAGIDVPAFEGQSAGQLLTEAFAIIFLRRGIKNNG